MEHDGYTYVFLTAGRKAWHHDTKGWEEVAWERFDYVECGVFRRLTAELTEDDKYWAETYGEPKNEFMMPSGWKSPVVATDRDTDVWYLVYDTSMQAQEAAGWILQGSKATRVLIIAADADVPEEMMPSIVGNTAVVRARDVIKPNWYIVGKPI